jgi:hypothetical protein
MQHRTKQSSGMSAWLAQLTARTHQNVAIVALANRGMATIRYKMGHFLDSVRYFEQGGSGPNALVMSSVSQYSVCWRIFPATIS